MILNYVNCHLEVFVGFFSKLAHNFQKETFRKFVPKNKSCKVSFLILFCAVKV